MFIRIAWQSGTRAAADPRGLRRPHTPHWRRADDLDVPARDFEKMTKGLFDRPE